MNQFAYKNNNKPAEQLKKVIIDGDISMVLILGGLGLILWALFGAFAFKGDLHAYANMFPFGGVTFWFMNYLICGVGMWYLVAYQFPPTISLLLGTWCSIVWSWSALGRLSNLATFQTGNATSVIYIIIGLLIIQRTSRLH